MAVARGDALSLDSLRARVPARARSVAGIVATVMFAAIWLPAAQCVLLNVYGPMWTMTMVGACVAEWREGEGARLPDVRPLPIDRMPKHAVRAALVSEDQRFFEHGGFDWDAIGKAWDQYRDPQPGRSLRGGSTISQQVARNVFLWQGRTWIRKGLEAWYTVFLETFVSKERILELYLNVAETGPCVFGLEAASWHWYGKPASKLTASESAAIVSLLPAPRSRTPQSRVVRRHAVWITTNRYQPPVSLGR